jgi:hypothetical protein
MVSYILEDVKTKIQLLKRKSSNRKRGIILHQNDVKTYLEQLQKDFVLVPTDKAGNNIAVVCKNFYIEKSMEETKSIQRFKEKYNLLQILMFLLIMILNIISVDILSI